MKQRCLQKSDKSFSRYGGRGITVCESWLTFDGFFADMGARPSDHHSLERIDNEIGYEPGNCKWATGVEQANNKRTNHVVTYRGNALSIADAARSAGKGVPRETATCRIRNGWTIEAAVETPLKFRRDPETRRVIHTTAE